MKLIDLLDLFASPYGADKVFDEVSRSAGIDPGCGIGMNDLTEIGPAFVQLGELIRAGAFEDYPPDLTVDPDRIYKITIAPHPKVHPSEVPEVGFWEWICKRGRDSIDLEDFAKKSGLKYAVVIGVEEEVKI